MYTPGDMGSKIRQKAGNSQVTTNSQKGCKSGLFVLGGGVQEANGNVGYFVIISKYPPYLLTIILCDIFKNYNYMQSLS